MGRSSATISAISSTSSMESSSNSSAASSSSSQYCRHTNNHDSAEMRSDISTDLKLGLNLYNHRSSSSSSTSTASNRSFELKRLDWPPIKPLLRRKVLKEKVGQDNKKCAHSSSSSSSSLFIKVYMDGLPIGRKLDLLAHDGYDALITALAHMFRTTILSDPDADCVHPEKHHVLTYQDREGDWMMVGDVPWEMFLTTVQRLKITRADKC